MAKRLWSTGVIAVVVMIIVGACSTGSATPTPGATAGAPGASATAKPPAAVPSLPTGYTELDQSLANPPAFKGKTVTIQTQWVGGEGIGLRRVRSPTLPRRAASRSRSTASARATRPC